MTLQAIQIEWSGGPIPAWIGLAAWLTRLENSGVASSADAEPIGAKAANADAANADAANAVAADGDAAVVSIDDARDIRATLQGDGDAFGRLVRRYQNEIARYMWRFTRNRNAWEELVQDVFVEAYFSLDRYQGRAPFVNWLRRIATRTGYRFWKSQAKARRAESIDLVDQLGPARKSPHELEPAEAAELIHVLLARLAPRDRLVLTLSYLEEMPVAKIAETTGWSPTLVKVQAHRAKARLTKLMQQMETRS